MPNRHSFAMVHKESGEVIGCIGLVPEGDEHYAVMQREREVGYWIGYPYWGQGLTTEALKALLSYCRNQLGLYSVLLTVDLRNYGSRRVAEKCGFIQFDRYDLDGVDSLAYRLSLTADLL